MISMSLVLKDGKFYKVTYFDNNCSIKVLWCEEIVLVNAILRGVKTGGGQLRMDGGWDI